MTLPSVRLSILVSGVLAVLASCTDTDSWVSVGPLDSRIQYLGRTDVSSGVPYYAWSGVSMRLRFRGQTLALSLEELASGGPSATNYYAVFVDDQPPVRLEMLPGSNRYLLAEDLPRGEHEVQLVKLTEAAAGSEKVLGFDVLGTLLEPPAPPPHRLELIGDSISCGYGNEVVILPPPDGNPSTGYHAVNQNAYTSWGFVAARELNASLHDICYSGRGLYRNNTGTTEGVLPEIYERILPNEPALLWDFQRYVPEVIVINLGTNDFDLGLPPAGDFQQAYSLFVTRLRQLHPTAHIVCAVGPMLNDYYPPDIQAWTHATTYISTVVNDLRSQGDARVHYLELAQQENIYGEDWHPTQETHRVIGLQLAAFVRSLTGW